MAMISWNQVLTQVQQPGTRVRATVHIALILLLSYTLTQLSWRLIPTTPVPEPVITSANLPQTTATPAAGSGLQNQIAGWHLFGELVQEVVPVAAPIPVDLPETKLQLTLRGVIASADPQVARAIVADPSKKENFYRIGDQLPGNAVLSEIHADRIVIKRGANYETLKLPKESLNLTASNAGLSAAANPLQSLNTALPHGGELSNRISPSVRPRPTSNRTPSGVTTDTSARRDSYSLKEYRDGLLNDPQSVADVVRITPFRQEGKFAGYQLNPGRDPRFLSRYGLQPGDVVTSINGVVLDSPSKGFSLMNDLRTATTLDLVVERNGVQQHFTVPIN